MYDITNGSNSSLSLSAVYGMEDSILYDMQNSFMLYVLPALVVIGTFSNLMTVIIIKKSKFSEFSVGFYLYVYAIDNLLTLYAAYGLPWISYMAELPEVENLSDGICRMWAFLYRLIMHSGIWFVTAALIDRYICVAHPDKALALCQVFMSKIAVLIIIIGMVVISVHGMWSYELIHGSCYPLFGDPHYKIWQWTSATCYTFIPMVVLSVLSIMLLVGLCTRHQNPRFTARDTEPNDLIILVLSLSIIFLLLSLPATVVSIVYINLPSEYQSNLDYMKRFEMIRHITDRLTCGNPVILLFVCMIFSPSFRQEIGQIFLGWRKQTRSSGTNEMKCNESGASGHMIESQSNDTLL